MWPTSPKRKVVKFLSNYGIDYKRVIAYLKKDCKINKGFEAQRVGLNIPSATTTGLITYVLGSLNELNNGAEKRLKQEILSFKIGKAFDDSAFGSQLYSCTWATSQCLLGLLSLKNVPQKEYRDPINWLCKRQSKTGGWSFSGAEEDKIIYLPYSILALRCYYKRFSDNSVLPCLRNAYRYLGNFEPENNIDRIIKEWGLKVLGGIETTAKRQQPHGKIRINFTEIIKREFANYVVYEHSIYPFSMQFYTPACYLFTRKFLPPEHPFNLYLIKYLLNSQVEKQYWSHITSKDKNAAFSFCTALSLLTLYAWAYDVLKNKVKIRKLPSFEELRHQTNRASNKPPRVFISYSRIDNKMAKRIADGLRCKGCKVWFDEWKIKVGDSIINEINKGIREADFLLILLSKNSVRSRWVKEELSAAKMKEISKNKVFVLPILLEDCAVPPLISDKKYADFRISYKEGMKGLLKVLEDSI